MWLPKPIPPLWQLNPKFSQLSKSGVSQIPFVKEPDSKTSAGNMPCRPKVCICTCPFCQRTVCTFLCLKAKLQPAAPKWYLLSKYPKPFCQRLLQLFCQKLSAWKLWTLPCWPTGSAPWSPLSLLSAECQPEPTVSWPFPASSTSLSWPAAT